MTSSTTILLPAGLTLWRFDIFIVLMLFQVSTFADMEGEETFEPSFLGFADEVLEERIADDDVILIKGTKNTSAVSHLN